MIDALRSELAQVRQDKADRSELQAALAKTQRTVIVVGVVSMAVHLMVQAFKTEQAKPISTGSQGAQSLGQGPVSRIAGPRQPVAYPHRRTQPDPGG